MRDRNRQELKSDLKWAVAVLAGVALGFLVFSGGDPSGLLGALVGVTLVLVVRMAVRRRRRA